MNFNDPHTLYWAYGISNLVGVFLLWAAWKRPKLARLLYALLFGWACWINYTTSHTSPQVYLAYADQALPLYAHFIRGWFSRHITVFVSAIAAGQGLIALGLWFRGTLFYLACAGIIIFLLAIAPLGLYAAFPFALTAAAGAWLMARKPWTRR